VLLRNCYEQSSPPGEGPDPIAVTGIMTGVSALAVGTVAKRLQLVHELIPAAEEVAFLRNPTILDCCVPCPEHKTARVIDSTS